LFCVAGAVLTWWGADELGRQATITFLVLGNEIGMRKKNDKLKDHTEAIAQEIVARMTQPEIGLSIYPKARPVPLRSVPEGVVRDHLGPYTCAELENGQFLEVRPAKYTFFMDHEARKRRAEAKTR